jgi:hypothetical protein
MKIISLNKIFNIEDVFDDTKIIYYKIGFWIFKKKGGEVNGVLSWVDNYSSNTIINYYECEYQNGLKNGISKRYRRNKKKLKKNYLV